MATTTRIVLLLFTSIFFLFTLFCFTPFSHFSSPIVAKALSFFHHNADDAEAEAVSSISVDQHHGQSIISPAVDEKDVVVLTKNNFSDFVNRNQYVMLNFYAPWSYWSQKLAPEYAAAATMLKGKVVLAKIDATQETELARKFNIRGYSTVYLSVGGVRKVRYFEERTRDAISNWVNKKLNNTVENVTTVYKAYRILDAEPMMVLGFLDTLQGPHSEELAAVSKLHIDVKFYQTSNVDVAVLFHIDPQIKRPALIMRKRECVKYSHFDYEGQFTRLAIADFVSVKKLPSVITFTEEDASNIFENPMKKLWLFTPQRSWKVLCIFKEAANAFKGKLLFVHVEIGDELSAGRRLSHEFGLTEGSPTVVAYYKKNGVVKKHIYDGELSLYGIKSFAEEFMEDKFLIKAEPAVKTVIRLPLHSHASDPSSIPPAY
ncbi:hypothetical protein P3X46_014088 [Hevea brasiliensis]|uniref:Thioredoxin domain-containing protein n=1 Tax=Hevea brasiliensis TaxID=3981 RepID=A0ABQ9M7V7_HEVBR|nr:protein disulfide isomerase-like 1-3 [Hevea brasiliensis]KAJ9175542.1 hypothetical protein P3X46_014088 [Hevea brasiliensis]